MKVIFDCVSDFLAELGRVETKIVRVTGKRREINNGVSEMYLKAGFLIGENLHELTQHCGETYQGDKSNEMLDQYQAFEDEIVEFCKTKSIEVRGGEYDG